MVHWFCDSFFRNGAFSTVISTAVWKSAWGWKPGNCWELEPCGVHAWWGAMLLSKYDSSCNWRRCLADLTLNFKCHHISSGLEDASSSLKSCSASSGLSVGVRWGEILKPNVNSHCRLWEQTRIAGPTSISQGELCIFLPSPPLCFLYMKWHAVFWKWEEKQKREGEEGSSICRVSYPVMGQPVVLLLHRLSSTLKCDFFSVFPGVPGNSH